MEEKIYLNTIIMFSVKNIFKPLTHFDFNLLTLSKYYMI